MWTDGITEVYSRVEELEEENDRLKSSIKEANSLFSEGDFASGLSIIINLVRSFEE